jgi:hypothetical protein
VSYFVVLSINLLVKTSGKKTKENLRITGSWAENKSQDLTNMKQE